MNKTIAKIGFALLTIGSDGTETYGPIEWLQSNKAGGREFAADPVGEKYELYADGACQDSGESNNGYDIKVTLLSIIDKLQIQWLGFVQNEDGSIDEIADGKERPHFALFAAKERFNEKTKYEIEIYFNCNVSKRPSKNDKTFEGKFDPQFPVFEISAKPRLLDGRVVRTLYVDELLKELPDIMKPTPEAEPTSQSTSGTEEGTE